MIQISFISLGVMHFPFLFYFFRWLDLDKRRFNIQFKGISQAIKRTRGPHHTWEDDNLIFRWSYRFNEVERALVQIWTIELLDASLLKLSMGQIYASSIMMPTKNNNFVKWIYGVSCVLRLPFDEQWTHSKTL